MKLAELAEAKRIVVKVGSSNLTDEHYRLDPRKVEKLVQEIVELRNRGKEVILVSSGAVGAGIGKLGMKQRPREIKVLQATAAVGQSILMSTYDKYFSAYDQIIAQVLLTHSAFFNRQSYLNLRNTLVTLLKLGIIPIINENDTVAVDEIKLGDNDNLSALVACNLDANLLIILTNTDGLFTYDPRRSKMAELIQVVEEITPEIERIAEKKGTAGIGAGVGVGGMKTKLKAAKITMKAGIPLIIANGSKEGIIGRIIDGERIGTLFKPKIMRKMTSKGHWILFASTPKGRIEVDEGAKTALIKNNGSLLPPGIISVVNEFRSGDTVSIVDTRGVEFARGLSNYSSSDIEKIKGRQSREIKEILRRKDHNEVVYRGNLVLL